MPKVYGFTEFGDADQQDFRDEPMPVPGPGELLIAVRAASVNPVDVKIRSGAMQAVVPTELPAVMGREAAGVVEAVGKDVDHFAVGDEVMGSVAPGSGGFAEYTLLTASATEKKPVHVSFVDAACLPVAAVTGYAGVAQLGLTAGQTLLITGIGGGIGVAAAQIARDLGLNVLGTASTAKRDLAESLGATLIDYTSGDVAELVRAILPDGVDGVLDLVGGDALTAVAPLVTDPSKVVSATDPQVIGLGGAMVTREREGMLARVAEMVADGKLDPHAVDVVPFDKAADAVNAVASGHARGKVVLQIP
jgi:NADPH:quinone reductase-like Zn-dependent oxidoreductase